MEHMFGYYDYYPSSLLSIHTPVAAPTSVQPSKEESKEVMLAGQEIERALLMVGNGLVKPAMEVCAAVHSAAIKLRVMSEIKLIKDKLLEAGLEVALAGNNPIAKAILQIAADKPPLILTKDLVIIGTTYHPEADACWHVLEKPWSIHTVRMEALLAKAINERQYLKCVPYFLGKVYEQGLYKMVQDPDLAKKYLEIAAERGYEPGKATFPVYQWGEYKLLLKAQQSEGSVFFELPLEVIKHIARLRFEVTQLNRTSSKRTESNG